MNSYAQHTDCSDSRRMIMTSFGINALRLCMHGYRGFVIQGRELKD